MEHWNHGECPSAFGILGLEKLETSQIGYWYECHKEQETGGICGVKSEQVRFPRDEDRRLDTDEELAEENTRLAIKYPE